MYRIAFLFFAMCGCGNHICAWNAFGLASDANGNAILFDVDWSEVTPSGIRTDRSTVEIDTGHIDTIVGMMASCVDELIDKRYSPVPQAQCLSWVLEQRQDPCIQDCLKIKMVEPVKSLCSGEHTLGVTAPEELCIRKGLVPDDRCPCQWRWVVQRDYELITTIDQSGYPYLYDVVRIMTGCNNPWKDEELLQCIWESTW